MDYIQQLEWRNFLLQSKVRILNDLKNYVESADASELSLFAKDLASVFLPDGRSLRDVIFQVLSTGNAPPGWKPFRYFPTGIAVPPPPPPVAVQPIQRIETEQPVRVPETKEQVQTELSPEASSREQEKAQPREDHEEISEKEEPTSASEDSTVSATPDSNTFTELKKEIDSIMVAIKGGSFLMGSEEGRDEEKPVHKVSISSFKMAKFLVTNRQYKSFIIANPEWQKDRIDPELHDGKYLDDWTGNEYPEGKDDHPVSHVSYYAASAFAEWVGKRLPTEAEWEYAARGGLVGKKYPNGDKMNDSIANLAKRFNGTTPVGQFDPNGFGLYDMAGNLFEWTADWYAPYSAEEQTDPKGPSNGEYKVIRGGSWISSALTLRVSFRIDEAPERCGYIGIRLAE